MASSPPSTRRIVLTGGPGAGKSVVATQLAAMYPERYAVVPEAATQVYLLLATRWDRLDLLGRCNAQRMIFTLQVQQEQRIAAEHPGKILLLDRGTVDGAAYWPDGPEAYWKELSTTLDEQLARYDTVIWLQTAAALGLYDGDRSNATRFEDAEAAVASGNMLMTLWGRHPRLIRIDAQPTLQEKLEAVERVLSRG